MTRNTLEYDLFPKGAKMTRSTTADPLGLQRSGELAKPAAPAATAPAPPAPPNSKRPTPIIVYPTGSIAQYSS
ncbi:hypothetical protein EVAR_40271_1 [Eumeta japonica]|uniref:Uncharacterized protein n=1 Tax=Eumeta variegata TaxID=151549 RepID=A0A4C1WVM2_EUMVA|nr:hypothetical protein EVAR_40271_1 [Eumeta japonica]